MPIKIIPPAIDATSLAVEDLPVPQGLQLLARFFQALLPLSDGVKLKGVEDVSLGTNRVLNSQAPIKLLKAMCRMFHKTGRWTTPKAPKKRFLNQTNRLRSRWMENEPSALLNGRGSLHSPTWSIIPNLMSHLKTY